MPKRLTNPYFPKTSAPKIDCKDCPFWSELAGNCTIDADDLAPCGRRPQRQDQAEFGRLWD